MDQFANSKLIDVLNKLTNGNKLVQFQAISKLHSLIVGEIGKNETEKKKLLNKIIEVYGSISSKNACISLLDMFIKCSKDGFINYEQLINSFLIIINSKCENSIHCLEAITQLMLDFEDDFIARYSIRNPSHPFIEILSNSNESFSSQLIYNQIRYIFDLKKSSNSLSLVKPVMIHLFLEESPILKHQVANYLIQNLSATNDQTSVELINLYFSCIKFPLIFKKRELKSVFLLDSIGSLLKSYESCNEDSLLIRKIPLCRVVSLLIDIDQTQCCDCSSHFNAIKNLITIKNSSFKKVINTELIELLGENLGKIGLNNLMSYLDLIYEIVVNYSGVSKLDLVLFIPNILAWNLWLGSLESIGSFNQFSVKCSLVVSKIQERLNESSLLYDEKLSEPNLYNLIEYQEENAENDNVKYRLLNRLCANFILNESELESIQKICLVFKKLIIKFPHLYPMIFCINILKLRLSSNHEIISYIVNSMVDLISPKVDLSLSLNVIKSLMSQENLASIKLACIRLMTKLCTMKFDYIVYPLLSKELVSLPQKNDQFRLEALYTKAYSIFQIVSYRPDYYAQELLATISNLLNSCSSMKIEQGVCALLIDSLAILCESQVLDMKSTWNALNAQYKSETRPLTLAAYCRFISVVCKIDNLNDSENEFYLKMEQTLWSIVSNDKAEQTTISSALLELSKFKKDAFKCSFLPIKIQESLKQRNKKIVEAEENKGKSLDEMFPQIQAACYIELFNSLNSQTYPGLKELFISILSEEIDAMPRRIKSLAREKVYSQDEQRAAQKAFYDHLRAYLSNEDVSKQTNLDSDLDILVILFGYDAPGDRNLEGKLAKRHIKSYWENYEKTYGLILRSASNIELNEANVDLYKNGFVRFIKAAYFACTQAIEFENEVNKAKSEEKCFSSLLSRDKLTEILVQHYFESSANKNDDVYILILLAIVQITSEQNQEEESERFNQRKWLEVIIDFILNIRETKTNTGESEYINQFNYTQSHSAETLRFLFRVYNSKRTTQDWAFLDYFMCETLSSCMSLSVSSFLIQYIERIVNTLIEKINSKENDRYVFKSISAYIRTLIRRQDEKFDVEKNAYINSRLQSVFESFKSSTNQTRYLSSFVECLFSLYDDDSIYYDDINLLSSLIELLDDRKLSDRVESLVYLSCIAYKSNLIGNELIHRIYDILNKESKYNKLLGFYLRYLLNYGFIDALAWIQTANYKWHSFYNDFKLNLVTDLQELEQSLEGLLVLHSGVSIETLNIDQPSILPIELENILKPEATIKDILKFLKTSKLLPNLKRSLSYLLFKRGDVKYEETYSSQNTYDYLDNQSLLKVLTNESLRISKTLDSNDSKSAEDFRFLIEALLAGWRTSTSKSLPPINWLNLVNTLLKSRFGNQVEAELIELVLGQIENSNSAFALVKNYLIDTNYFTRLQPVTQRIVLENLSPLFNRLNDMLLRKFLTRLKVFLLQKWSHNEHRLTMIGLFSVIFDSIYRFFERKNDEEQIKNKEIVEFFMFIVDEFTFSVDNYNECLLLQKIVKIAIQLKDERLKVKIIDLNDLIPVEPRFIMKFYFRTHLTSQYNQPISLINEPIESFIKNIEIVNDETKSVFLNSFAKCLLELIFNDFKNNPESKSTKNADNVLLNWIIDFMNLVKSISMNDKHNSNCVRFAIQIYKLFLECTTIQSIDLYDVNIMKDIHIIKCWSQLDNLDSVHKKFSTQSFWKQINLKTFDWLISLMSAKNFPSDLTEIFKSTVIGIFTLDKLSDQMWFKFANLINKNIN